MYCKPLARIFRKSKTRRHPFHGYAKLILWPAALLLGGNLQAQSQLPDITVSYKNGKPVISWTVGYGGIKQIGIQRSQDSLFNYSTIGYASSPGAKVNAYTDNHARPGVNFYRLFILMSNNAYFFSHIRRLELGAAALGEMNDEKPKAFSPSVFVYTNPQGNVNISLADAAKNHYRIRFMDADDHFVFEVTDVDKPLLIVDKSNFLHTGWYHYELYENGKVKEKWMFYIGGIN